MYSMRFRPGRSTTDKIFNLQQMFEKSREYPKNIDTCFIDLEKANDLVSREKLWVVPPVYDLEDACF